jgi:chromosome partitioning protein
MKSFCFCIQKGGVGKTSLSVTLAVELAKTGATVLVDADSQGNASAWIGPESITHELSDVLLKQCSVKEAIIKTAIPNLYLLPSASIGGGLSDYESGKGINQPNSIKHLLRDIENLGYRYTVIDTNPGWNCLSKAAVHATDEVITPILGDSFASDGLRIFASKLKELREDLDSTAAYRRIIVNAIDRRIPQHTQTLQQVQEGAGRLHVYSVPVEPAFRLAQRRHLAIQNLTGIKAETREVIGRLTADLLTA